MLDWYKIENIDRIDSPALVIYPDRVRENIDLAIKIAGGCEKLRPHIKTNKMSEVCLMMQKAGITKYKCATIAEAEMLAIINAPDILLAYQPVGPKILRFLNLIKAYPDTTFSCLIDNEVNARTISNLCKERNISLNIYIDLNIGMNRTGVQPENAVALAKTILESPCLKINGLHGYDGHIHDENINNRQKEADKSFALTEKVYKEISLLTKHPLTMIMGGTPTFPTHIHRDNCECSPGTFVFWDWGYKHMLHDLPFHYAALVISRVISIIDKHHVCIDLGHKSIAAENPLPRVHFLNAPEAEPIAQSEEHLVLKISDSNQYEIGRVLYGVPVHICPTVALYEKAYCINDHKQTDEWKVIARNRFINY
ncbi:D-TA family PLP-dependent enzyme [Dysgonomonas sp. Marseille-P4677]|uniref:D-TA family PLP-dependent enzyme n=1 Tax=Dysgonomonas sp. Marseille-P4677 TaxID=2364790 RepID=UPI0019131F04|nr:D-TA family PLP-dependent enzyme [Dysgonomonas sp. Marseille-P4677]MBK5719325.1 D-TA family PLP-dependent enzyme [Dysgonomonas sp. Marseille-P4677]